MLPFRLGQLRRSQNALFVIFRNRHDHIDRRIHIEFTTPNVGHLSNN